MQHRLNAHIGAKRERIVFCEVCSKTDPDLDTECVAAIKIDNGFQSKIINVGKLTALDTNSKIS